jgi:cytochrome P450
LQHATSAARIAGSIDDVPIGPLADLIDAIAHELREVLGNPHLIAAPVPSARSSFVPDRVAHDGVPELVALDAPGASRTHTLITDHSMQRELAGAPEPAELEISFTDDATTQPHVRQLGPMHGRPCQRVILLPRPAHGRRRQRVEKAFTTRATEQQETRWVRSAIATALIALLGVIAFLALGACGSGTEIATKGL